MSLERYDIMEGVQMVTHRFPEGVVALDVDEPEGGYGANFLNPVRALAARISQENGLGLYWLYQTLHGYHVIFQCQLASHRTAFGIMLKASLGGGVHECWGHLDAVADNEAVELRVSHKHMRPWDIFPVPGNPPASICPHVAEHEALLAKRMPAKVAA